MRTLFLLLCFPLGLFASPENAFMEANALYDQGNFEEALRLYQDMDAISPALDYNTGNTLMRLGRTSEAIAYYRRAQWQAPGDPDIQANLERAVSKLDAPVPEIPLTRSLTGWWTPDRWQQALVILCWVTAGIGFFTTVLPRYRPLAFWTLPPAMLFLLIAGLGTWSSLPSNFTAEAVVKGPEGITRFEPLPDATQKTKMTGGTVVSILETTRDWVRVESDGVTGWIQEEDLVTL